MLDLINKYKTKLIQLGVLLAVLISVYGVAVVRTNANCKVSQAVAQVEGVKENEVIRQNVRGISTPDLDKRLMRWVQQE